MDLPDVRSNVFMAALHALLSILVLCIVVLGSLYYLKAIHGIDVFSVFSNTWGSLTVPMAGDMFDFIEFLVEDVLTSAAIMALLYGVYMSSYEIVVEEGKIDVKRGFLLKQKHVFDIADVDQVYTKPYPFFKRTKEVWLKALDEETLKIPYVVDADDLRDSLIRLVKETKSQEMVDSMVEMPINEGDLEKLKNIISETPLHSDGGSPDAQG